MIDMTRLMEQQKAYFLQHLPFSLEHRLSALNRLRMMIKDNEQLLYDALYQDLKKPVHEAMTTELSCVLNEISFVSKRLSSWMQAQRVGNVFPLGWFSRSYRYPEPYGVVAIIAPWNYPVMLSLSPIIGALAAGNCVILKPSELASQTASVLYSLISRYFDPQYVAVVTGDARVSEALIAAKPNYILFTGSTAIGKQIMQQAARHLIPVTLELGGKCPVIVDETANIPFAAKRIAWAKMMNAGQTCIAPDFLYVQQSIKEELIAALIKEYRSFYGNDIKNNPDFARIISESHCQRLVTLLTSGGEIRFGGTYSIADQYIEPTLIDGIQFTDPIMATEIFGPLLPILTFETIAEVITTLHQQEKPLALYYFTTNQSHEKQVLSQLSFGGGAINDCMMQVGNWHLPFGGVGQSGMGAYHGRTSFDTFSHYKSIYKRINYFDYPFIYPPYTLRKLKWLKWILR